MNRKEIINEILSWHEDVRVDDFLEEYQIYLDIQHDYEIYEWWLFSILFTLSIIMVLVYGYFHLKDIKKDYLYPLKLGVLE